MLGGSCLTMVGFDLSSKPMAPARPRALDEGIILYYVPGIPRNSKEHQANGGRFPLYPLRVFVPLW